jgi:hypothetical protein
MSKRSAYLPREARDRAVSEVAPDPDVVGATLVHHAAGTEPTTFKPGVLRILVREEAASRIEEMADRAEWRHT